MIESFSDFFFPFMPQHSLYYSLLPQVRGHQRESNKRADLSHQRPHHTSVWKSAENNSILTLIPPTSYMFTDV